MRGVNTVPLRNRFPNPKYAYDDHVLFQKVLSIFSYSFIEINKVWWRLCSNHFFASVSCASRRIVFFEVRHIASSNLWVQKRGSGGIWEIWRMERFEGRWLRRGDGGFGFLWVASFNGDGEVVMKVGGWRIKKKTFRRKHPFPLCLLGFFFILFYFLLTLINFDFFYWLDGNGHG